MNATDQKSCLSRNLAEIQENIAGACRRSGRRVDDVQLVAVTKYAPMEWVELLSSLHSVFGENRPQQLAERAALLPEAQWHLIGQLQRNKVRMAVEHAAMIHSVDSLRLLERIRDVGAQMSRRVRVLIEVNVSGEASKSGFSPDEICQAWPDILKVQKSVSIEGLMTMAPEADDPEEARPYFRQLRELTDSLRSRSAEIIAENPETPAAELPHLSMGMSGDYVVAVEEGATLVRIGSRVFQGLK